MRRHTKEQLNVLTYTTICKEQLKTQTFQTLSTHSLRLVSEERQKII